MDNEEFERLFNEGIESIFGTRDIHEIENEVVARAKNFQNMEEVVEYMNTTTEALMDYQRVNLWGTLMASLSPEFVDDNFAGLLDVWKDLKSENIWNASTETERFISNLPEELKLKKYEYLINFILDESNKDSVITKLQTIYKLPANLENVENYEAVLNKLESVANDENHHFYIREISKKIISSLPSSFVSQNYKPISERLFSLNENLAVTEFSEFVKKIFNPNEKSEIKDEQLIDMLTFVNEIVEKKYQDSNYSVNRLYKDIIETIPSGFIKSNAEICFSIFSQDCYQRLTQKMFSVNENEKIEDELLRSNLSLYGKYGEEKFRERLYLKEEIDQKVIGYLPNDFIRLNAEVCFTALTKAVYKELTLRMFNGEDGRIDDDLIRKNLVVASKHIDEKFGKINYLKDEIYDEVIELLPNDFIKSNAEMCFEAFRKSQFSKLCTKIFTINDGEDVDVDLISKNLSLVEKYIKDNYKDEQYAVRGIYENIIDLLPNEFFRLETEQVLSVFNKENYLKMIPKIFSYDENEEIQSKDIINQINLVKKAIDEKFDSDSYFESLRKNELYAEIIKNVPPKFLETNIEFISTLIDKKFPEEVSVYLLENLPGEVISKYEEKLTIELSLDKIGHYQKYFEYILSNSENVIISSDVAVQILNFINSLPNNEYPDLEKIKEYLEHARNKYEHPDMSRYNTYMPSDYSKDFEQMDAVTFDNFIKELERVKFLDGFIPECFVK